MNENISSTRNFIIAIIVLAALLAISAGSNIGLGIRSRDASRLRDSQQESERTITALTAELRNSRWETAEARGIIKDSSFIVTSTLTSVTTTGTTLARAVETINKCIVALKNLDLLYSGVVSGWSNGLDPLGCP